MGSEPTVVAALWRGVDVFRPIAWLYAVHSTAVRHQDLARPWLAWLVLAVLGAWTVAMLAHRTRTTWIVGAELALACGAILCTALVDTPEAIVGGAKTLPGFWPAAAVVSWAVLKGWRAGMVAAFLVGLADILEVGVATENTVTNIVILVLLGGCIGYCADLSRDGHAALGEALREQAEMRERDRLARAVHDGVLQTLSFIHRRGVELGGEAHKLGSMAADQERLLRVLVSDVSSTRAPAGPTAPGGSHRVSGGAVTGALVDLRVVLARAASASVMVIPPAEPVLMGAGAVDELAAAVGAALDNVRRHAGDGAQAWVLIEDDGKDVTVTIRDNGMGIAAGRLGQAAVNGRMGVAHSIRGRIGDLSGTVVVESTPGVGTAVELTVPKREPLS